jgi:TolA-binding protein
MTRRSGYEITGSILAVACVIACGTTSQRPATEEANGLVIPPLGADAGNGAAVAEPTEPVDSRSALTMSTRDPRIARRHPRSRAVVLNEVQSLERLLDSASPAPMDRPAIRRRLAEAYNELAYTSSGGDAEHARDESIKHYTAIKDEHPHYPQIDEAYYYLGIAFELKGDLGNARRSYFELIQRTPQSKLVPLAYFAFGELFYVESASDPSRIDLADQAFKEVLKYPPPDNAIYPETLLRLGQIELRRQNDERAKALFDRLRHEFPSSAAAGLIPHEP